MSDIALIPFGAAASASTSTKAAFDKAKAKGKIRLCRPSDQPFEIPGADARIYVLGPPHDPKLIRKINPSTSNPMAMTGGGALSLGVVWALNARVSAVRSALGLSNDPGTPFHPRVTIPLRSKEGIGSSGERSIDEFPWTQVDEFFRGNYFEGGDWRRIDGDWLASAPELALALQSYANNTSLVLALELGEAGKGDVLLFAADAQVGNWESWQLWECAIAGGKVTGPDLLKRTIFYKVGHHGSHNATLKEHGLEQMTQLKAAIVPVDEKEALKKRWGRMPLPDIIAALEQKAPGMVLRTDQKPAKVPDNVVIRDDYFEITL